MGDSLIVNLVKDGTKYNDLVTVKEFDLNESVREIDMDIDKEVVGKSDDPKTDDG